MEKEQLEKMQWGRRAKAIKAVNPDYNCEGKSEEELKTYMKKNNIKMTRSKKEDKEEKKEKEEKEENIDEVINNLIEESNKATTDEDKLEYLAKIQKNYAIKKKILEIEEKKKELEEMEKGLEDLKGELNKMPNEESKEETKEESEEETKKEEAMEEQMNVEL